VSGNKYIVEVWLRKTVSAQKSVTNTMGPRRSIKEKHLLTTIDVNIFLDANRPVGYVYDKVLHFTSLRH
jgi:hypothetical protein